VHIREVYAFLANNYAQSEDGNIRDDIYLIGFSGGSFTVRSLAGFMNLVDDAQLNGTKLDDRQVSREPRKNEHISTWPREQWGIPGQPGT